MRRAHSRTISGAVLLTLAACFAEFSPGAVQGSAQTREADGRNQAGPVAPRASASPSEQARAAMSPRSGSAKRVVLVSIDGLRPDAISPNMRGLHRLYLQGAYPHVARTIEKSATLPSHASMVTGVDVAHHGIDFNAYKPERGNVRFPTIFSAARAGQLPAAMFVGKSKLRHLLARPGDAHLTVVGQQCRRLVDAAMPTLRETTPGLVFLHFADPDSAGHRIGWMTDDYLTAVDHANDCLERVIETIAGSTARDSTLLIVTSDHGGHNRSHGTRLDVDRRIPWYAWGAGVRRGPIGRPVHTTDTAATVLSALGLPTPQGMQGQPVAEALADARGPSGMNLVGTPLSPP